MTEHYVDRKRDIRLSDQTLARELSNGALIFFRLGDDGQPVARGTTLNPEEGQALVEALGEPVAIAQHDCMEEIADD